MARNRAHPRISITKLAEYLVATAGRRHSILVDQKFPSAFKAAKWTEAYPAIADVIAHGGDARLAEGYLDEWRRRVPSSEHEARQLQLWREAMTTVMTYAGDLALGESFADGVSKAYVPLDGVEISVRPDLIVTGEKSGAVKLYLGKSSPLTKNAVGRIGSGTYAAALLHLWAERELGACPDRCFVLDVLTGELFTAPDKFVQRRKDAAAACGEISILWRHLEPEAGPGGTARAAG